MKNHFYPIHLFCILLTLSCIKQNIFAQHEPYIPRDATETRVGPFELGKLMPKEYLQCNPYSIYSDEWVENNYFIFENPDNPNNCIRIYIHASCVSASGKDTICTNNALRKIRFIEVESESLTYKPFTVSKVLCKLNMAVTKLITSGGIGIGDSLDKVLRLYGLPSTHEEMIHKIYDSPYYIMYTKECEIKQSNQFDFKILNNKVIAIRIYKSE